MGPLQKSKSPIRGQPTPALSSLPPCLSSSSSFSSLSPSFAILSSLPLISYLFCAPACFSQHRLSSFSSLDKHCCLCLCGGSKLRRGWGERTEWGRMAWLKILAFHLFPKILFKHFALVPHLTNVHVDCTGNDLRKESLACVCLSCFFTKWCETVGQSSCGCVSVQAVVAADTSFFAA